MTHWRYAYALDRHFRFWVHINGSPVRIKLKKGDMLR